MFTKEERLFIWKKAYEMIDRLEDGEYICVALRNVVFMYFKTHALPRSQDRANIMFNYHLTHKWDQYYH